MVRQVQVKVFFLALGAAKHLGGREGFGNRGHSAAEGRERKQDPQERKESEPGAGASSGLRDRKSHFTYLLRTCNTQGTKCLPFSPWDSSRSRAPRPGYPLSRGGKRGRRSFRELAAVTLGGWEQDLWRPSGPQGRGAAPSQPHPAETGTAEFLRVKESGESKL